MTSYPVRSVLEGVPRVHFYEGGGRCPEDIILPSVVRAVLEYLGEEDYGCKYCLTRNPDCIQCTYTFLMGVSGAASFLSWKDGWHPDNVNLCYMSADPTAPEQRIFDAVGYEHEWVVKTEGRDNEALFKQRIAESIRRGMPVLGCGVVGPPEPSIIAGYDEGGDVLIGWSHFQDSNTEYEPAAPGQPTGYFRKRDWFEDTVALLIIGDKKTKPAFKDTCRDALRWMLQVTRTPMARPEPDAPEGYQHRHNGLAAYEAWAEHLLRDDEWPADNEELLRARYQIHSDAVGTVAEERAYGSGFLTEVVTGFEAGPGKRGTRADLVHAAACYAAEHDLMWEIWKLAGNIGDPQAHLAMADPTVRHAMVDVIRQARDQDAQAAKHIEQALA